MISAKKNLKKIFFFAVVFMPLFAFATVWTPGQPIVPCATACDYNDFIQLIQNVITFLLYMAAPIAAGMFAWAGWLYMSALGDTGKIAKATSIFGTVFWGIIIALSAWLAIKLITDLLIKDDLSPFSILFLSTGFM